MRFEGH